MANPLYGANKSDNKLDVLKNVGDGDFSDAKYLGRYIDYMAGYQGNLTATGVSVSEAEAVAALAAVTSADQGDSYAATLIAGAVNTSATTGAAGTIHLPQSDIGTHLCLDFADVHDSGTNALTIAVNGGAAASTGSTLITGGLLAKQAIGVGTGVAGNSVETAGTYASPTSVNLIYTATTANNFLGVGSVIHFFCPVAGEWLVRIDHVQQGTGETGALSVS
ncbi:hypothetical protein CMI47_21805 [Candidatus Pacearchaeota archaeon]|nr:hypothetical protein [Candidatus Pacearchaeota archaeon]|tara:strand:+ start:729 stop:1391 length:663 start_codon:yes stop_codon:yes gene_type:complete